MFQSATDTVFIVRFYAKLLDHSGWSSSFYLQSFSQITLGIKFLLASKPNPCHIARNQIHVILPSHLTTVIQLNQLCRNNFQHIHLIFSRRSLIDMAIRFRKFHEYLIMLIMLSMVISSKTWVWSYRWQPHLFRKCQRKDHVQSLQQEIALRNYQNTAYSRIMRHDIRGKMVNVWNHIFLDIYTGIQKVRWSNIAFVLR